MKGLYELAGISRQAVHKSEKRTRDRKAVQHKIFEQADRIRKAHPRAGCRKMAVDLCEPGWGRDKIETILLAQGYRLRYKRRYQKTTQRQHLYHYPNLIGGLQIDDINQVVQTDITYYLLKERFYYLTFIIDVYSRRIIGYATSKTLQATANIQALKMLFRKRKGYNLKAMIHHSDKGSQYIDTGYRHLLNNYDLRISMCDMAWENAYAERINRTIKEEYLDGWHITDYRHLELSVHKAVIHYNHKRKHKSLKGMTPYEFEKSLLGIAKENRNKLSLYN